MNLSSLHENWQGILTALVAGITLLALLLGRRAPDMAKRAPLRGQLASGAISPCH